MEKPQPMERLLCGDVGYGKTEVALRAAFKAVLDGKQVAVLALQQCWHSSIILRLRSACAIWCRGPSAEPLLYAEGAAHCFAGGGRR